MGLLTTHIEHDDFGGGRHRQVIHIKPIAYPHQGGLRRITNTLANSGDPSLPIGVSELVQFRVRDRLAGNSPVYHFGKGQSRVRFTPLGTANVNGQVSGQSTTFPGAWNGADLKLTIAGHILHEDISLYAGHPRTFAFRLDDHQGFDPLTLSTPDFRIVNPVLTHPTNPLSVPLAWQTSQQGGKWVLSVTLPDGDWQGWTLDPTIVLQPAAADGKDTTLMGSVPTFNFGIATYQQIGTYNSAEIRRSLLQFSVVSILSGQIVQSASLTETFTIDATTNARTLAWYPMLQAWTEGTAEFAASGDGATWNTYDGGNNWPNGAGGFGAGDCGQVSIGSLDFTAAPSIGQAYTWPLGVATIQGWVNGTTPNNGLLGRSTNETLAEALFGFASSDHATAAYRPTLTVVTQEAATELARPWNRRL